MSYTEHVTILVDLEGSDDLTELWKKNAGKLSNNMQLMTDKSLEKCHTFKEDDKLSFDLSNIYADEDSCRVNFIHFYGKDDNSAFEKTEVTAQTKFKDKVVESTNKGSNLKIKDNEFAESITIVFGGDIEVCEIIMAGTEKENYNCTIGHFYKSPEGICQKCQNGMFNDMEGQVACKTCEPSTVSTPNRIECERCNYLSYTPDHEKCYQCTRISDDPPCYSIKTNTSRNLVDKKSSIDTDEVLDFIFRDDGKKTGLNGTNKIDIISGNFYIDAIVMIVTQGHKQSVYNITSLGDEEGSCKPDDTKDYAENDIVFRCAFKKPLTTFKVNFDSSIGTLEVIKIFAFGVNFSEAPVNRGQEVSGNTIKDCEPGTYSSGGSGAKCTDCPANQYTSRNRSFFCDDCENGLFSNAGAEKCEKCKSEDDSIICNGNKGTCKPESEFNKIYGNITYNWPAAASGSTVSLTCKYNGNKYATRKCIIMGKVATYGETDFSNCDSEVTEDIEKIAELNTATDALTISEKIKSVAVNKGDVMNNNNVEQTAAILDNLISQTGIETIEKKITENIVKTVDGINLLTEADELAEGVAASKLTNSMKSLADKIANKKTQDDESTFVKEESVGLAVVPPGKEETTTRILITGDSTGNFSNSSLSDEGESVVVFDAEVPQEREPTSVTAIIYTSDKLYPSKNTTKAADLGMDFTNLVFNAHNDKSIKSIGSIVAEVSYKNKDGRVELSKNLYMDYSYTKPNMTTYYKMWYAFEPECRYYNTISKTWESDGCVTNKTENQRVTCSCNHMTSFAVMLTFTTDYDISEDYASHILLAISLGCLICTIIAYLPAKDLLKKRTVRLNLLLVTSLIFAIITFYFMEIFAAKAAQQSGQQSGDPTIPCIVVGFLMNYFWLCQIAWMVTEAVVMYIMLVSRVENSHISRYLLKFNAACWGIPLIFPVVGIAIGQKDFVNPQTCFLNIPYAYGTFYAPVVIAILFNIFIFVRVWWTVNYNQNQMGTKLPQSDIERRKKQLKFAVTVMTLLGTAWIFGFFLIIEKFNTIWLRWIFILLNSTQGIWIFILYVVMNESLRKVWLQLIGATTPSTHSTVPYSRSKGHAYLWQDRQEKKPKKPCGFTNSKTNETTLKTKGAATIALQSVSNEYRSNVANDGTHIYEVISNSVVCSKHSKGDEPPVL